MRFTIELHGVHFDLGEVGYRLQCDRRWRLLGDRHDIVDVDFTTEAPADVIRHSPPRRSCIEIDGVEFKINPDCIGLGESVLEVCARCCRSEFPDLPSREQLRLCLSNGDDSIDRVLVLGVHGEFELRDAALFEAGCNDPTIAVRHDAFHAGHGFQGPAAAENGVLVDELFANSLEGWLLHLAEGWTQLHTGYLVGKRESQVTRDLEDLRVAWTPQAGVMWHRRDP
jgi:hypothetical protein